MKEKVKKAKSNEKAGNKNEDAMKRLTSLIDSMRVDSPRNTNSPEVKIPSPPEKSKKPRQPELKTQQEKLEYVVTKLV